MKPYIELLEDAVEQYVGAPVLQRIRTDPSNALAVSQQVVEVTVFFMDLRSFSQWTKGMSPEEIAFELNNYLATVSEILVRHNAYIDSLIGDEVFAIFGLSGTHHADDACSAALECLAALEALNKRPNAKVSLDVGIGINSGKVMLGNIGSRHKLKFTAIGDNVNLGARMERSSAQYGCHVVLTDTSRKLLTLRFETREIDTVSVKGMDAPLLVYSLEG
jgi:adenylate cyclase